MKSKKYAVMIHQTTNDVMIKSDTIGLVKAVGYQPAEVVRATVKDFFSKLLVMRGNRKSMLSLMVQQQLLLPIKLISFLKLD